MNILYAISSAAFAVLFLGSIMVFGGEWSRNIAIGAAFLACASQFMAQDPKSYKGSIFSAYAAFVVGLSAYLYLLLGN
jgi:hypothetical protein